MNCRAGYVLKEQIKLYQSPSHENDTVRAALELLVGLGSLL
jgi:hypothetical protein